MKYTLALAALAAFITAPVDAEAHHKRWHCKWEPWHARLGSSPCERGGGGARSEPRDAGKVARGVGSSNRPDKPDKPDKPDNGGGNPCGGNCGVGVGNGGGNGTPNEGGGTGPGDNGNGNGPPTDNPGGPGGNAGNPND